MLARPAARIDPEQQQVEAGDVEILVGLRHLLSKAKQTAIVTIGFTTVMIGGYKYWKSRK